MSDMYALIHYAETNSVLCHMLKRRLASMGVCGNINHSQGHVTNEACKSVLMDLFDTTYYCIDRDIMAMEFEGVTIADMYRRYLRSKEEWLRSDPGQAMLALVRSTPSRSLLEDS